MLCILSPSDTIFYNLAAEEFLIKNCAHDIIMIWRSQPSVVVGKHQNAYAEVNHRYVNKNGIRVARRISGGGAVYHDQGNINFTFIMNGKEGHLIRFDKFLTLILEFLHSRGIPAVEGEKHNLLINNLKISGNAEHIFKNRTLHHGTLLFNSQLQTLEESLKGDANKYSDKAVKSNRAGITNIADHLENKLSVHDFTDQLFEFLLARHSDAVVYSFDDKEDCAIKNLSENKYRQWTWIYAYSPEFKLLKKGVYDNSEYHLDLRVDKGIAEELHFGSNSLKAIEHFMNAEIYMKEFDYIRIKEMLDYQKMTDGEKQFILEVLF